MARPHLALALALVAAIASQGCTNDPPSGPVEPDASSATCPGNPCSAIERCVQGRCHPASCPDSTCMADEVCFAGECEAISCIGVTCGPAEACARGRCFPVDCSDQPCGGSRVCDDQQCVEKRCAGVRCAPGELCRDGTCGPGCPDVDLESDPDNCGACGRTCPRPAHSVALCHAGQCGRGPCEKGFFDLDGNTTFGCESTCGDGVCVDGEGHETPVTAEPLHETGLGFHALVSGSSQGSAVQTSRAFTNIGALGEPTPPLAGGSRESRSSGYRNIGGFGSMERR